jgi:putative hemin transport protein
MDTKLLPANLSESIRGYFQDDPSRMTMMAARKFAVPEQAVVDALVGQWPIVRLRDEVFRDLMESLPTLGLMRVFVRSKAAVIESVGEFGGYSETGPFFNVQTDTLDMHIRWQQLAAVFAVEKPGHLDGMATRSFQFFDQSGAAAFKVFLNFGGPIPPEREARFVELRNKFKR